MFKLMNNIKKKFSRSKPSFRLYTPSIPSYCKAFDHIIQNYILFECNYILTPAWLFSKHESLAQCWANVGPTSKMVGQH